MVSMEKGLSKIQEKALFLSKTRPILEFSLVSIFPDEFIWNQTLFEIIVALGSIINGTTIAFLPIATPLESTTLRPLSEVHLHPVEKNDLYADLRFSMEIENLTMKKALIIREQPAAVRIVVGQEMT